MIPALQKDDALLNDIRQAEASSLHLWWLGQSGFLVKWQNTFLLLDPYLSDSLTLKYQHTDKPHVRMTEQVIAPEKLDFISCVVSSHNHSDHLDPVTLQALLTVNPSLPLLLPEANHAFAQKLLGLSNDRLIDLNDGQHVEVGLFHIHGIPAAHNAIDRDPSGRCLYLGYVVQAGPWTIYHSGDTLLYPGLAETLRKFSVDVALLPINGNVPARRVAGNLDGAEAATLAHDIGAKCVVPCHYDLFAFNTETPELFLNTCRQLQQPFRVLQAGERLTLTSSR
jgi:L-ascorbate metabolism protein UlaG (beta-lactamase superfamily)